MTLEIRKITANPARTEQVRVNKSTHAPFETADNSSDRENDNKEAVSSSSTQSSEIPNK